MIPASTVANYFRNDIVAADKIEKESDKWCENATDKCDIPKGRKELEKALAWAFGAGVTCGVKALGEYLDSSPLYNVEITDGPLVKQYNELVAQSKVA